MTNKMVQLPVAEEMVTIALRAIFRADPLGQKDELWPDNMRADVRRGIESAIAAAPEPPSVEAGELPPLPSPAHPTHSIGPLWSAKQMLAYGAICASRPAPVGVVDDAMVERACEAYWIHWNLRGYYNAGSKAAKRKLMMPALQAAALTPAAPVAESVAEYVSGYCASCGSPCDIDGTSIAHPNKVSDPPPVAAGLTVEEADYLRQLEMHIQGDATGSMVVMDQAMARGLASIIRRIAASPVSGGKV